MQTFGAFLVSFLAASGLAAAMPTKVGIPLSLDVEAGSFSLTAVRQEGFVRDGPSALAKAIAKYGKPVPTNIATAVEKNKEIFGRSTGSATTIAQSYDSEYLTPVQIGTPAQTLNLDFDTGSSDLWVISTETTSAGSSHKKYAPAKSSTAKKLSGATWAISYGDGSSSSGDVYTDVVTVGGLTVKAQAVESAKKASSEFISGPGDGLLGLGFSSINTVSPTQQKTFFDSAKSSLTSPLFTADLKHNANGKYNFGYIDTSAYTGKITYTAVDNSQGFWAFTSKSGSTTIKGIADTGTTLLLLPDAVVKAYYKKVSSASYNNNQGGYTFSCSATLPAFTFSVSGTTFTIPGSYMNYAPIDTSGKVCFGGLQSDADIGISIYGDIALKAAFVVFNAGTNQLGWAAKRL